MICFNFSTDLEIQCGFLLIIVDHESGRIPLSNWLKIKLNGLRKTFGLSCIPIYPFIFICSIEIPPRESVVQLPNSLSYMEKEGKKE